MNAVILETLQNFTLDLYRPVFKRDLDLGEPAAPKAGNMVTVVTGMRRSGKTYRLFQVMDDLLNRGVSADSMLYFNFEDDRLDPVTPATGDQVIEAFYALHPASAKEGVYLFLDELQEMKDWGRWLRRVIDTMKATIYVSGSSSKMLSSEFSTELRGRSIEYIQYPLSFKEYVQFHRPDIDAAAVALSTADRVSTQRLFERYLKCGGFPAVQSLPEPQAVSVLQGYAQRVVARDVVERHDVGKPQAATGFARKVLRLNGRTLSLRKAENELKSSGVSVGRAALSDYLVYLEEAFLVLPVRERMRAASGGANTMVKAYAIDPGLARANAPASARDDGQSLEDAVCVELHRRLGVQRSEAVSFGKTREHGYEIDFVVGDALFDEGLRLYQVTESLNDARTHERETRALWEGMREYGLSSSTIVVGDGEEALLEKDGMAIRCVPAWKWFLQG
ncbi:MAG: ATP-binding protein [Eggerthellaceae bacterium]|nr:ATP-binding protein [Eggerthellaceae bacterium]